MQEGNQPPTSQTDAPAANSAGVKSPKAARDQRASVQNHLMFSEIRDGIVIMRDGSLRMVILCSAVNFDLKSAQEQDAIEFAYQGFLNGLHFPVQIVIRSRKLDLDAYLEKLDKLEAEQDNQLLAGLMEDYIYNVRNLLQEVNIMNKEFYMVVPLYIGQVSHESIVTKVGNLLKPNQDVTQSNQQYDQNKRDLIQRTNLVAQGLAQMGVRAVVLSTQELVELFYTAYNLDEAQSQSLIDTDDMTTAAVTRGPRPPEKMPAAPASALNQTEDVPLDLFEQAHQGAPSPTQQARDEAADANQANPTGGAQ